MEKSAKLDEPKVPPRHPDEYRSRLRGIIARIDSELPDTPSLQAAWRELGNALSLGPEPETRSCPTCTAIVMRDATRCGHCWTSLTKAAPDGA